MVAVNSKTRKQTEIQAATINRVMSKSGQFLGYSIKSDSSEDYYEVTWNEERKMWQCKCPASVAECKHCRAASQVCQAKAEIAKQGNTSPAPMPYSEGLKTSFSSVEEEYEYRLHAYGKRSAVHWAYEQKQHTAVEVVPAGQAEEVAAVAEVQAEAKMDAFLKTMDEETRASNMRAFYNGL